MTLSSIKHLQKRQVASAKYYSDLIEARQSRAANAQFRKDILEKQKVYNYQSEYDRQRAHLASSATPHTTREQIQGRRTKLEQMGAKATSGVF